MGHQKRHSEAEWMVLAAYVHPPKGTEAQIGLTAEFKKKFLQACCRTIAEAFGARFRDLDVNWMKGIAERLRSQFKGEKNLLRNGGYCGSSRKQFRRRIPCLNFRHFVVEFFEIASWHGSVHDRRRKCKIY